MIEGSLSSGALESRRMVVSWWRSKFEFGHAQVAPAFGRAD
jgi:hypothetical protein